MTASRLAALRTTFDGAKIDGLLVVNEQNRRYLSGFTGSAGGLIMDATRAILVTDGRYTDQAHEQAVGFEVAIRGLDETLVQCVARLVPPLARLGFEASTLTVADHADYTKHIGPAATIISKARPSPPSSTIALCSSQASSRSRMAGRSSGRTCASAPSVIACLLYTSPSPRD